MRAPPHKIQNPNQSKSKHLYYTRKIVHKGISPLRIHKGNISSKLDLTPLIVIPSPTPPIINQKLMASSKEV